MTTFRCKTKKQTLVGTRETLHSKHLDMIKHFSDVKKTLASKRKNLAQLKNEMASIDKINEKSPEDYARILDLKGDIDENERSIVRIDTNEEEDGYYMANGDLIFQYFQNIDEIANESTEIPEILSSSGDVKTKPVPTVIDFFKENIGPPQPIVEGTDDSDDECETQADDQVDIKKMSGIGLNDWIERKENFKRAEMLDKYMSNIDPTHVITIKRSKQDRCPDCDSDLTLNTNEGIAECLKCGHAEEVKVDSDKRSYKEATNTEMSYIAYKRINHFEVSREWNSPLKMCHGLVACAA